MRKAPTTRRSAHGLLGAMAVLLGSPVATTCAAMVAAAVALAAQTTMPTAARAGELYIYQCNYKDSQRSVHNAAPAFAAIKGGTEWLPADECPFRRPLEISANKAIAYNHSSLWLTQTPSEAIKINTVYTPPNDVLTDCHLGGDGYNAQFFWGDNGRTYGTQRIVSSGGACNKSLGVNAGSRINIPIGRMTPSRYFGWSATCGVTSGCNPPSPIGAILGVSGIGLGAQQNTGPALLAIGAGNLYYENEKYVRGDGWQAGVQASDPSGVCDESVTVDGRAIATMGPVAKNQSQWLQCGSGTTDLAATVNTTGWANGRHTLSFSATNAAGVQSPAHSIVTVDNAPVTLSLSGPTDVPVAAGTQHVLATASAGVSGVAGIACSTDGGPYQWHPEASVEIPVQGLGGHLVRCYTQNRAVNASGVAATSAVTTWRMSIRYPTVISASFGHLVDKLRCATVRKRERVPGAWVRVRRRGKLVRVRRRAHTRTIAVRRCHPRMVARRERVKGHWRVVRVPVLPHVVQKSVRRVAHDNRATISGWLGLTDGAALGRQTVRILTAPDNGENRFSEATVAITGADGSWSARLAPGPSRLVEAVYGGGLVTEPTASGMVRLVVPAKIRLRISPRWVAWSGRITLSGRLLGGYVPPDGVALRLRVRYPGGPVTLHALRTDSHGAFRFAWSFGSGKGIVTWPVWVATVSNETDYAYAASSSAHIPIKFGGHPPPRPRSSHSRHRRRRHRRAK